MGIEIERKFLVDHDKWKQLAKPKGTHFRQGYVLSDDNRTIRIRVTDKHGYITFKGASSGISRPEFEYEIPIEEGLELLKGFALSEIEKVRYCIEYDGKVWEVDEFAGDNSGLIMAEIELTHEEEIFKKPYWATAEVSDDERYYNAYLSTHPFKNWDK
jgi:adenylate cyclase